MSSKAYNHAGSFPWVAVRPWRRAWSAAVWSRCYSSGPASARKSRAAASPVGPRRDFRTKDKTGADCQATWPSPSGKTGQA